MLNRLKNQIGAALNPIEKMDECIKILEEEYKQYESVMKVGAVTAAGGAGASAATSHASSSAAAKDLVSLQA